MFWICVWVVVAALIVAGLIVNATACDHRWQLRGVIHTHRERFGAWYSSTNANVLCEKCGHVDQIFVAWGHHDADTIKTQFQIQKRPEGEA